MKKFAATMLTLAALASGCESSTAKKPATASRAPLKPSVTDISPTPPAGYAAPIQPIQPVQPVAIAPVAATPEPAAAAIAPAAGSTYTVQKGDTLYKIARDRYGDGKQWQKIASANPGLSPSTLKVGQKIAIP
jgi:5'-nucleotidase / UDP-sugar diphosphatase